MYSTNKCTDFNKNITNKKEKKRTLCLVGISIIQFPSELNCLPVDSCFSELALNKCN